MALAVLAVAFGSMVTGVVFLFKCCQFRKKVSTETPNSPLGGQATFVAMPVEVPENPEDSSQYDLTTYLDELSRGDSIPSSWNSNSSMNDNDEYFEDFMDENNVEGIVEDVDDSFVFVDPRNTILEENEDDLE